MQPEEKQKNRSPREINAIWKLFFLMLFSTIYGVSARFIFGSPYVGYNFNVVSLSFLLGLPVAIGALTVFFVGDKVLRGLIISFFAMVLLLGLFVFAALEIWICVLMAAVPMFLLVGITVLAMWLWNRFTGEREKPKRMNAFTLLVYLLIPYIIAPIEAQVKTPDLYQNVEDSILIENSSPEIVWENIIRMDTISSEEQFPTLFQMIGIPRPIRATLREEGLGQLRVGEFEYGLRFQEVITIWEPYEEVAFTIRVNHNNLESPALSQIGGEYLDIVEAAYRIETLENGQIRLHLSSTYRVTTNFNFYAAFWADWIMHDFQAYVLRTAKARIESQ